MDATKPKKSVALSGITAGNTALCTVGRSGNDLHYRGYDILEVAETCEFEELAYLLIHGKLPNASELMLYKAKLRGLRGTALDVFGYTAERRTERALIGEYEKTVTGLLDKLDAGNVALAADIAGIPEQIRGYGHVKDANLRAAKAREAELLKEWDNPLRIVKVA